MRRQARAWVRPQLLWAVSGGGEVGMQGCLACRVPNQRQTAAATPAISRGEQHWARLRFPAPGLSRQAGLKYLSRRLTIAATLPTSTRNPPARFLPLQDLAGRTGHYLKP